MLLPAIHDGPDCALEPLSRAVALREVVSSTIAQIPGADGAVLSATAAFMRQLPCYRLRIGADMERIAARVADLVRSRRMKILMASERFFPDLGGVEVFTARLAAALLERGHEVALITSRDGLTACEEDRWGAIPVHRLPFEATLHGGDHERVIALRRRLAELKRALRPDVVHLNTSGASLLFHLLTGRAASAPSVLTVHWLPNRDGVDLRLCERALAAADWIVAHHPGGSARGAAAQPGHRRADVDASTTACRPPPSRRRRSRSPFRACSVSGGWRRRRGSTWPSGRWRRCAHGFRRRR